MLRIFNNSSAVVSDGGTDSPSAGTVENWTMNSTDYTGFPVSLASGDYFHVADPVQPSEKIRVTAISGSGPYTWTVTRGDEGTVTGHASSFTVQQVISGNDFELHFEPNLNRIYIDDYGADPTGNTKSDSAWTAAWAAAQDLLIKASSYSVYAGCIIVFGCGIYQFSTGVVECTDMRIGMTGMGKSATVMFTTGDSGNLVQIGDSGDEPNGQPAAPCGGFSLYGWSAGNSTVGVNLTGSRARGSLYDVDTWGFNGTSSYGFYITPDDGSGFEDMCCRGLSSQNDLVSFCFDGGPEGSDAGTFDYSSWELNSVGSGTALQVVNGAHCFGGTITLKGNIGNSDFATCYMLVIGSSSTDTAHLRNAQLHVVMEADSGSTTIYDITCEGESYAGIDDCYGVIGLLNNSGSFSAGSLSGAGPAKFSFWGPIRGCPLATSLSVEKLTFSSTAIGGIDSTTS